MSSLVSSKVSLVRLNQPPSASRLVSIPVMHMEHVTLPLVSKHLGVSFSYGNLDLSKAPTPIARAIQRVVTVEQVVRTYRSYNVYFTVVGLGFRV